MTGMEPLEPLPEAVDQAQVDAATSVARRIQANIRRAVEGARRACWTTS